MITLILMSPSCDGICFLCVIFTPRSITSVSMVCREARRRWLLPYVATLVEANVKFFRAFECFDLDALYRDVLGPNTSAILILVIAV